jgi:chromosome segregation ATPase
MTDYLSGLEEFEQELAHYRSRFQKSSAVLEDLAKVQKEFDGLSQQYEHLKVNSQQLSECIDEAKSYLVSFQGDAKSQIEQLIEAKDDLNKRLASFETSVDNRWQENLDKTEHFFAELQAKCQDSCNKVTQSQESYKQQFQDLEKIMEMQKVSTAEKLREIERTLEEKLVISLQEFQASINQVNQKLETTTSLIKDVKVDTQEAQNRLQKTEEFLTEVNKRTTNTESLVYIIAGIGFVSAIILAILPFIIPGRSVEANQQARPVRMQNQRVK